METSKIFTLATAGTAFVLAFIALGVTLQSNIPNDPGPSGICVAYDVNTVGTYIESPKVSRGVISCEVGSYVEVNK